MLLGCPGGTQLILDCPGFLAGEREIVAVERAQDDWDNLIERAAFFGEIFEIIAPEGAGATLSRWQCSVAPVLRRS